MNVMEWNDLFKEVNELTLFHLMEKRLENAYKQREIFPSRDRIFRAFDECPLDTMKVVWIGQDPYHDGKATGLAMGVENTSIPPTLRILSSCAEFEYGQPIKDFSLKSWANQGVLLLNAALTVERKKPGSHSKFWAPYVKEVLQAIADHRKDVIWVALGKNAQQIVDSLQGIPEENIVKAPHPMVAQYSGDIDSYTNLYLYSTINDKLNKIGLDKICFTTGEGEHLPAEAG